MCANPSYMPRGGLEAFRKATKSIMSMMPSKQYGHRLNFEHAKKRKRKSLKQNTVYPSSDKKKMGMGLAVEMKQLSLEGYDIEKVRDEEEQWDVLQSIKAVPKPFSIRKSIRDRLFDGAVVKLSGFDALRYSWKQSWMKMKISFRDLSYKLELWGRSFKAIEGRQGTGVLSYFVFLKWILFLDVCIFLLMLTFITVPMQLFPELDYTSAVTGSTESSAVSLSRNCSALYSPNVTSSDVGLLILDAFQGTGWMEKTALFYGFYASVELQIYNTSYNYNMPLAFLLVTFSCFLLSLILMARNTASSFKEGLRHSRNSKYNWWNKCFGSWDFTLNGEQTADVKHKSIQNDFCSSLAEQRFRDSKGRRSCCYKCRLYTIRLFINLVVLACLGGSGYLIYFVTDWSTEYTNSADVSSKNDFIVLLVNFLPSITITVLNIVVPIFFEVLVEAEEYSRATILKLTLARGGLAIWSIGKSPGGPAFLAAIWTSVYLTIVILRLSSLGLLVSSLYTTIVCSPQDSCSVGSSPCTQLRCWESFVGQQFYKLVLMDFFVEVLQPFCVELPRKLLVKVCNCGLMQKIGPPEFQITMSVLDLVYSQTILWLGFFFAPILPAMCIIKFTILFYVKKVSAILICSPTAKPYKASKSNTFFMIVLIISFFLCCFPVVYVVYRVPPSKGCGPFRVYDYMDDIVTITLSSWPSVLKTLLDVITSSAFAVPFVVLLCLSIYYCTTLASVNKEMAHNLKEQLIMESKDKHFLLTRINELSGNEPSKVSRRLGSNVNGDGEKSSKIVETLLVKDTSFSNSRSQQKSPTNSDTPLLRNSAGLDRTGGPDGVSEI